jgi:hypothetical protein
VATKATKPNNAQAEKPQAAKPPQPPQEPQATKPKTSPLDLDVISIDDYVMTLDEAEQALGAG